MCGELYDIQDLLAEDDDLSNEINSLIGDKTILVLPHGVPCLGLEDDLALAQLFKERAELRQRITYRLRDF